jgi:hypothetical protein
MLGYWTETNVVTSQPGVPSTANEHVVGQGLTLGYGFTRQWAAYINAGWGGFQTTGGEPNRRRLGGYWGALPCTDRLSRHHPVPTRRSLKPHVES